MLIKKKSHVAQTRPRDEHGHFLPGKLNKKKVLKNKMDNKSNQTIAINRKSRRRWNKMMEKNKKLRIQYTFNSPSF